MGRFYQSTAPEFVDSKMFQLPYEFMAEVIAKKDKEIQEPMDILEAKRATLTADVLKQDNKDLQDKILKYSTDIDNTINNIRKDPMNYMKYMPEVTGLKNNITADWTRGDVAKMVANKAAYTAYEAHLKELQKQKPDEYNQAYIDAALSSSLGKFKGTNYKDLNNYNTFSGDSVYGMQDMNTWVAKQVKEIMPDIKSVKRDHVSGNYIVSNGTTTKQVSEADVYRILQSGFNADPELQSALRQRAGYGLAGFENLLDENGAFLPTIGFDEKGKIINRENIIGNAFKKGMIQAGFTDSATEHSMKADDFSKILFQYNLDKKKEEEESEFFTQTSEGNVKTYSGASSTDWNKKTAEHRKSINLIKDRAIEVVKGIYGVSDVTQLPKEVLASIQQGKYDIIAKNNSVLQGLAKQHRLEKFEQSIRDNLYASFRAINPDYNYKNPKMVKMWDKYVRDHAQGQPEVKIGWGYINGMTTEKLEQLNDRLDDSGILEGGVFNAIPPGTKIKNSKGEEIDLSGYTSFNDLKKDGKIIIQRVDNGKEEATTTTKIGKATITKPKTVITLADGVTPVNFVWHKNSLEPVIGGNPKDGKVQLQAAFSLNGTTHKIRLQNLGSTTVDKFDEVNAPELKARAIISRVGKGAAKIDENTTFYGSENPHITKGAANSDINRKYDKGFIRVDDPHSGKYEVYDMNDPKVRERVYTTLNILY